MNCKTYTLSILLLLIGTMIALSVGADEIHSTDVNTLPTQDSLYSLINREYQQVKPILEKSCFDCHSDQTVYPWYHSLPVIGGIIDGHIEDAKKHLDLSNDFPFGTKSTQLAILYEIKEEIEDDKMPLIGYRLLHWGTKIEGTSRDSLFAWIERSISLIEPLGQESTHNHSDH